MQIADIFSSLPRERKQNLFFSRIISFSCRLDRLTTNRSSCLRCAS